MPYNHLYTCWLDTAGVYRKIQTVGVLRILEHRAERMGWRRIDATIGRFKVNSFALVVNRTKKQLIYEHVIVV